jgi:hypothetical protein
MLIRAAVRESQVHTPTAKLKERNNTCASKLTSLPEGKRVCKIEHQAIRLDIICSNIIHTRTIGNNQR